LVTQLVTFLGSNAIL